MKVANNKVVALTYELEVEGAIADKATDEMPLEYIHGNQMLLPKFEAELLGKDAGEDFSFSLSPEDGYGVADEKLRIDLPKTAFEIDGKIREDILQVGRVLPMLNSSGQVVQGRILELKEDAVRMDFNHPMAGKTLCFKGKVISVRDASEKELQEGLHGEFLPEESCDERGCCCPGCEGHGEGDCCQGESHGDGDCCCKQDA